MSKDNEVTLRTIMLLCSECNEPLSITHQDEDSWRNVVRVKPCAECLLRAYSKGHDAASEKE